MVKSSHNFTLTFVLKDSLAKQVKLKHYTQVPVYEVLKQEAGICFTAKLRQLSYVFFHVSKIDSITVGTTQENSFGVYITFSSI